MTVVTVVVTVLVKGYIVVGGGGEFTRRHEQALLRREAGAIADRLTDTARFLMTVVAVTVAVAVAVTGRLQNICQHHSYQDCVQHTSLLS